MYKSFIIPLLAAAMSLLVTPVNAQGPEPDWELVLKQDLNLLGHRNWILVVDKAFPEQSSPGMKTIYVEKELLPVLEKVLNEIESSTHVKPVIYSDKELSYIHEEQVRGINNFKSERAMILGGRAVNTMLHDDVFRLLDEQSALFKTLVIKTNCTIPYSSFFLQLDCAYWGPEQEAELRRKMATQ